MNGDRAAGARMGGRAVVHDGQLYRWGQDCGGTYGRELVAWEVRSAGPRDRAGPRQGRSDWVAKRTAQSPTPCRSRR